MATNLSKEGPSPRPFDWRPAGQGLYDPKEEHENCGVGMVADIKGIPTRQTILDGLEVLQNIEHRGATGCDERVGDGAGILCAIPDRFFRRVFGDLPPLPQYAVGNIFFTKGAGNISDAKRIFEQLAKRIGGIGCIKWRTVPSCNDTLGKCAKDFEPHVEQVLLVAEGKCAEDEAIFQATLFRLRRSAQRIIATRLKQSCYLCSLSCRTITYKGMLTCPQLEAYYLDLQEEDFETHVAIVHARFSTNTFPSWDRAHPYRVLAHNGEINTIRGNTNRMRVREAFINSPLLPDIEATFPLFAENQTDSSKLDNIMELLAIAGRSLTEAALLMIPQAWEKSAIFDAQMKDFFKVQASVMEPWDGPACVCFTDSYTAGACLDRNGLRPCRYYLTHDNVLICGSEAGVITRFGAKDIKEKGRLSPGNILKIDFKTHTMTHNDAIKRAQAASYPFGKWIKTEGFTLDDIKTYANRPARKLSWSPLRWNEQKVQDLAREGDPSDQGLRAFGYTQESLDMLLFPMAEQKAEAMGSMGNDIPLACLSDLPRPVFDFFYQRFAQVSNPPIDPLRETCVMSLSTWIGPEQNLLAPWSREHCRRLWLEHPCLLPADMEAIYGIGGFRGWSMHSVETTFPVAEGTHGLVRHLVRVCHEACDAVRFGKARIVVLSDRAVGRDRAPIPSLLVAGAVHQTLVQERLRLHAAIVVDSGEPFEVAHHCLLATFGTDAVCPYNAYEAILKLQRDGKTTLPQDIMFKNYQTAVGNGILKVMAKMGVSTVQSYRGSQLSEPIGLHEDVTKMCFSGSESQVGGLNFEDIAERTLRLHTRAYPASLVPAYQVSTGLDQDGKYHLRQLEGSELHLNDPMLIAKLQEAARTNSRAAYAQFSSIHNRLISKATLRGQLAFRVPEEYQMKPIPLEEVEPVSAILKRFRTGAMSYGSISMEAHATLAIALNRLGGLSNTGEGGEDPSRFNEMANGDSANSAIKQIASGRFGVTIEYLANAKEIQIKVAQGAKPGEGGELGGGKVLPHIAKCRHSTPGVGLISPPPHHDIYSIEDLAQLIYDSKCANPEAGVSVKLVSELGVGVVAAGVAKCKADHILISGSDGGTGASKWTGIKTTGACWELGLAETHQTLVLNGLRGRVSLETDGQMRTGRDVVIAALLGAEHFGFATAPLIAMGCIMMRKCHLNTCPVGIATQNPELREKFKGQPEHVVNYLVLIAEETRVLMSKLGFRTIDEMIGRADVLTVDPERLLQTPLVLEKILAPAHKLPDAGMIGPIENRKLYEQDRSAVQAPGSVPAKVVEAFTDTLKTGKPARCHEKIANLDRSVGTRLSYEVYKAWGDSLPAGTCHATLTGTSGQSFGAFVGKGIFLELVGDAQDYFGKGLSGGMLAVYPSKASLDTGFKAEENVIIGNAALYGATTGVAFIRGISAERFAVRNSGAWTVVEGCGDHGCEYMTGGRVVVLGGVGNNFAAGMSGGVAWVWNPDGTFEKTCNREMVELSRMNFSERPSAYPHDCDDLKELLEAHLQYTGSAIAERLLDKWPECLREFVRVFPTEFQKALQKGDKGASGTKVFKNHVPCQGRAPVQKLETGREQQLKKGFFEMPTHDIEDMQKRMAQRPKIDDDEAAFVPRKDNFLRYSRAGVGKRKVEKRTQDFGEIIEHKNEQQVKTQAARCMDCGTPFCHQSVTNKSGCPLGNLIPEWNDLVKRGDWRGAFERLRQTNNFPEFTGRVCPAPCEDACVLGIIDDPVAIKSSELYIIDEAYRQGWMDPRPPPTRTGKTVAIVGSGPAGLAAADELNRMGHTVTVYERDDRPGGLMMYGVPNMKADKFDVVERRVRIMQEEGINFFCGIDGNVGAVGGPSARELMNEHDAILLATGASVGRDVDGLPGRDFEGIHMAMDLLRPNTKSILDCGSVGADWRQRTSEAGLDPPIDVAGKNVVVIGGGDTGSDCIATSVRHGASSITNLVKYPKAALQRPEHTPWPHMPDKHQTDYGHEEAAYAVNGGEDIRSYSVMTKEFIGNADGQVTGVKIVSTQWGSKDGRMQMVEVAGSDTILPADAVFLAIGFVGPEGPVAKQFGVTLDGRGNYKASWNKEASDFQTSNPKVFAAGDCRRGQSLVVWGIAEGRAASQAIHSYLLKQPDVRRNCQRMTSTTST